MGDSPNKVVQSSREVINHKLLIALDNPDCVAILASEEDLDALIYALGKIAYMTKTEWHGLDRSEEPARQLRAKEFCAGLGQLRREAFGESPTETTPASENAK